MSTYEKTLESLSDSTAPKEQISLFEKIVQFVSNKSGISKDDFCNSVILEIAVARHCMKLGAKLLNESDVSKISGARFAPGHPEIMPNTVVIEYNGLTEQQVEEMAKLLQNGDEKKAASMENILLISFDHFCGLDLNFAK